MNSASNNFQPNWVSVPGDTIDDILQKQSILKADFAKKISESLEYVDKLIAGDIPIDEKLAVCLSKNLGSSKQFWLNREKIYQTRLKNLEDTFINNLPIDDMVRLGWIHNKKDVRQSCFEFFDVKNYQEWKSKQRDLISFTTFRKSNKFASNQFSIAAWLRQGERLAETITCQNWNKDKFINALSKIRLLIKCKSPKEFIPKMRVICAECGVALVIQRTPSGCPASGATKFITDNKAMILLSFRYLTDDQFWFTFFHEAGHLVLHGNKKLFIEGDETNNTEEDEANLFSEEILIPPTFKERLLNMRVSRSSIRTLAIDADISLGIVVGQLQFLKRLNIKHFNWLKRKYDINEVMEANL